MHANFGSETIRHNDTKTMEKCSNIATPEDTFCVGIEKGGRLRLVYDRMQRASLP